MSGDVGCSASVGVSIMAHEVVTIVADSSVAMDMSFISGRQSQVCFFVSVATCVPSEPVVTINVPGQYECARANILCGSRSRTCCPHFTPPPS